MNRRLLLLLVFFAGEACAAAGKHWSLSVEGLHCVDEAVAVAARVHYRGPAGAVEAPVSRLVDGAGRRFAPRSVTWKADGKPLAEWLAGGGLRNIQPGPMGEVQLKYDVLGSTGTLAFEFGDIPGFVLARKSGACPKALEVRTPRPARPGTPQAALAVYRARYPCAGSAHTVEADHPPYLPRQLLVFGRGYLPNAREIELPMGRAPAQPYAYSGADEMKALELAAQKVMAADFPQYDKARHFAFNWGVQRSQTGNEIQSIGIYELKACPGA